MQGAWEDADSALMRIIPKTKNSIWKGKVTLFFFVPKGWVGETSVRQDERKLGGGWSNRSIRRGVSAIHPRFNKAVDEHFVRPAIHALSDIAVMRYLIDLPERCH